MHDYDAVFTPPATTSQHDPDAAHDQRVRARFARELAVMLDEHGQDYAAHLVRAMPTDGEWP
ncbi:hypothetical protein ACOQFV_08830 [Nocardiopsis changdeensis]|uniref:Uncharacterized protein n=1 Tax=Nocardiopsis changdeensis TaxID=2831969 RepID=A0ABX8BHN5_9ACTN|nr:MULTISPECIES: hypothetical protein [Nocardiopsis]QUX20353.1 hypothetical protein KGD84_17650 [Nocardiopsis changdeensis]QYX36283.1 hypothetical protein K1J57_27105 [Nocardiopsis sp. MT53]